MPKGEKIKYVTSETFQFNTFSLLYSISKSYLNSYFLQIKSNKTNGKKRKN